MRYSWYRLVWSALDWLFPPTCGGCGQPGARWCEICHQNVKLISSPCRLCGQTIELGELCSRCEAQPPSLCAIRSWAEFDGPIRQAWHRVKYRRDMALADALAHPLSQMVRALAWPIDLIIPVPLSNKRMRERGYNQADLLAKPLAWDLQIDHSSKILLRDRDTRSQVGLTRVQRRDNVQNAFQALPERVFGKKILLVDDVATSGSTLNACADALLQGGANAVYGLTLARAVLSSKP